MIRVGIDTQVLQYAHASGYGYYVEGLTRALGRRSGDELAIIQLESRLNRDLNTPERFWHDQIELPRVAAKARVDVLHQPAFSCPRFSRPVVWNVHDIRPIVSGEAMSLSAGIFWRKWLPFTTRFATRIVCISDSSRSDLIRVLGVPGEKIIVIPVGLPEGLRDWRFNKAVYGSVRQKFGVAEPFFTSVGTIQPVKNYPFLIDVFVALRRKYRLDHQLVIIGKKGWDYPAVAAKIKTHSLKEGRDVIITDYVSDAEKWSLMAKSEAFFFPSRYEGFGIPPIEAQSLGVPALVANNSSLPEVVGAGGVLCQTDNVASWLAGFAKARQGRAALIAAGKSNVTRFDWDRIAEQWLEVYRHLASGSPFGNSAKPGQSRKFTSLNENPRRRKASPLT